MAKTDKHYREMIQRLRWPLALTRAGMLAETLVRSFWPLWSLLIGVSALLMLGVHDMLSTGALQIAVGVFAIGALFALIHGARRFAWPSAAAARARLDATLSGRPIKALSDTQAIGADDAASVAVWEAHRRRMSAQAASAKAVAPDLKISNRDPIGLRYVALLLLSVGLLFGSLWRVQSVGDIALGGAEAAAVGPTWEGWIEPPPYTRLPTLYLNDQQDAALLIPENSRITLRLYGEVGALSVQESISGQNRAETDEIASAIAQDFVATQSGELRIAGEGGQTWTVEILADASPQIAVTAPAETSARGEMTLPFRASDDYEVVSGQALISLDLGAIERRYGLRTEPEPRDDLQVTLPLPIAGARDAFSEKMIEDFSEHPWANLPVRVTLSVVDAAGLTGETDAIAMVLSARHFFDPMAAAIIEQRRDLLWNRKTATRIAQVLRAVSYLPDDIFRSEIAYLRLRTIIRRLEATAAHGLSDAMVEKTATALWDLAVILEEGDINDARERMQRAKERLSEAMKNGASEAEIAELMQELRDATQDYVRQLDRQTAENEDGTPRNQENMTVLSQDDLQEMMDKIQELMKQGRMAEAEQALREFQEMMENMQAAEGGQGQSGDTPGDQAMEGLADTLREQQGLSDQAFRDLQEQFNPDAQAGESQGNEGRNGGEGRGQSHDGQGGEGSGEGSEGTQQGQGQGQPQSLAERQEALRQELERMRNALPGEGSAEGDAAREALDRAARAMEGAEEALRSDDLAEAIDKQAEAMEELRQGMRDLGEALAQRQQENTGQQGQAATDPQGGRSDPLGREQGTTGASGGDEPLVQGEDVYRRARELLDEIRRKSGDGTRPEIELEYLKRLLERF